MAVSVRMNPLLEHELEVAAKPQGKTRSRFIAGAVERALGRKDPDKLFVEVKAAEERGDDGPIPAGPSREIGPDDDPKAFIRAELRREHGRDAG